MQSVQCLYCLQPGPYLRNATPYSVAALPATLNNAGLKPEFTTKTEVGTELQFFNNRINVDFAYFYRKSTQLIVSRRIPAQGLFE